MILRKTLRKWITLSTLPLVASACATTATPIAPVSLPDIPERTTPVIREAKPALFVLKDEDTTIYLFGTIHLLPKDVSWFQGPVKSAFDSSDALVLEVIEPNMGEMMRLMNTYGRASDGTKLTDRLNTETRANYEAEMKKLGLPLAALEGKLPWLAYITIYGVQLINSGWDANSGVEKVLTTAAKADKKAILSLETVDEQFAILSGFSIDDQIAMLSQTVNEPQKGIDELNILLNHWMAGDVVAIGQVMTEGFGEAKEVEQQLLIKRNANWTIWLDKKMDAPGTYFVAVGAAHLAGDNSVQAMLANEGQVATRVAY